MIRTRVKICGITRIEDGLAAARAGADAVGLVFWPGTPRCIDRATARAICAALPPYVSIVGLFVDQEPAVVHAVLKTVPLDLLQFHGDEPPEACGIFGRPYIKAVAVQGSGSGGALLEYGTRYADAAGFLFDAPPSGGLPGGTGRSFDWEVLTPELIERLRKPVVLSGGLHAGNVAAAIRRIRPWAVDVSSGVEELDAAGKPRKGRKDPARIAAFIEEVQHADVRPA